MSSYLIVCLIGIFLRWSVSLYPYSGAGKPPMHGDYEAQRHWQEVTINLPIQEWYTNSSNNDLEYWGLDYPPLTAYHSLLCGYAARYLNPQFVALHTSRGFESDIHKLFMRTTVLITDLIIYIPAAFFLSRSYENMQLSKLGKISTFMALILYPGLYLIDYGHFQYNNVSLGLFLFAVGFLNRKHDYVSAIIFTLALNYKQMELYHALPFFFYLLGRCHEEQTLLLCVKKLFIIGFCVCFTFACSWLPFITDFNVFQQVIKRLFPIGRGLFEDKVASIWCSMSIIFKFKSMFDNSTMALICLVTTGLFSLPSCIHLFLFPNISTFKYSLVNVSFIFFLFSFHVHEKSILLVTIPACLIFSEEPLIVTWFFITSIISMLPLLIKDGLTIPTIIFSLLSYYLYVFSANKDSSRINISRSLLCKTLFYISTIFLSMLTIISLVIPPPARYPDLFPVIISLYSSVHFCLFCIYFHYCQFNLIKYSLKKSV